MAERLEDLLRACTVRVLGGPMPGAGFFAAPGMVVTCVHVIGDSPSLRVRWERDRKNPVEVPVLRRVAVLEGMGPFIPALERDYPDIAVLEIAELADQPCVAIGTDWPWQDDTFQVFGYPQEGGAVRLTPARLIYRGLHGVQPTVYLDLASDTIKPGMSGAAVLNQRTGVVCGVIVASKHPAHPEGALAIPWQAVEADLSGLLAANQAFHLEDQRWKAAAAVRRQALAAGHAAADHHGQDADSLVRKSLAYAHEEAVNGTQGDRRVPGASTGQPMPLEPGIITGNDSAPDGVIKVNAEVGVPGPPVEFIGRREDLTTLLTNLRDPQIPLIVLKGMGGIGKTALAEEAVRKVADENLFSTIFWHSTQAEKFVGDGVIRTEVADYSFDALLDDLLRHSQLAWSADATPAAKEKIVKGWLANNNSRVLIVLDNLETVPNRDALVAALVEILGWGKILITSRYSILRARAFTLDLEGLSPHDSINFLVRTAERQNNRNLMSAGSDILGRIRDVAGGAPLAMQLISGQMDYQPVGQVLRVIEEAGFNDLSYEFYSFLFRRTWNELDGPARKVMVAMRHFEGRPTAAAIQAAANMTDNEFYPAIARLGQRSMLAMAPGHEARYSLHPLTRYFINTDIVARWE